MAGSPPAIPPLTGIGNRLSPADITTTIRTGKGRMPGFPNLHEDQLTGLVNFLLTGENTDEASSEPRSAGMKYRLTGYRRFLDPERWHGYRSMAPFVRHFHATGGELIGRKRSRALSPALNAPRVMDVERLPAHPRPPPCDVCSHAHLLPNRLAPPHRVELLLQTMWKSAHAWHADGSSHVRNNRQDLAV